ncbi:hypothetical protein J6590_000326 [Homalodisca vitripennis]|nr:hypothetical protein J6590_000326 [Homalodisca vitripennis]
MPCSLTIYVQRTADARVRCQSSSRQRCAESSTTSSRPLPLVLGRRTQVPLDLMKHILNSMYYRRIHPHWAVNCACSGAAYTESYMSHSPQRAQSHTVYCRPSSGIRSRHENRAMCSYRTVL